MSTFKRHILLAEGARDNALQMFMPYLERRGINMSISQLKQYLLNKFVSEAGMHNLSLNSNFYLLGVARYYFNGDLTQNKQIQILYPRVKDRFRVDVCQRLDALVEILRNAYVDSVGQKWEQPEDFGNLTIDKLFRKYNKKINHALGLDVKQEVEEKPQVSDDYSAGNGYTYEILYSYEDAKKYNRATEPGAWCITYGKAHYDGYVKRLNIHYVVFKQNGYENVPRKVGKGYTKRKPHDAYGNSLICVLQSNKSPQPIYITSRWNHGSSYDGTQGTEADHAYTTEEFLNIVGCDGSVLQRAFDQWKAVVGESANKVDRSAMAAEKLNAMRQLKYAQMLINGGNNPFQIDWLEFRPVISDDASNWAGKDGNYNPKGLFWVIAKVNDNESYLTFMDRKQIMFDKYLVSMSRSNGGSYLGSYAMKVAKTYITFRRVGETFSVYDRLRKQFLTIDGVDKFKHGSGSFTYSWRGDETVYNWGILGVSSNQLALVNMKTLKPIKARNGSAWFETILSRNSRFSSNKDYRNRVELPDLDSPYNKENLLKMVYDSSANEVYWFSLKIGSFIDIYENVPEGMVVSMRSNYGQLPSSNYCEVLPKEIYSKGDSITDVHPRMFKNLDDNSYFKVKGVDTFNDFKRVENVISFRPEGTEDVYYADLGLNKLITFNGVPLTTKYKCALEHDNMCGYYLISLSRWYKNDNGNVTYDNFYKKVMIYNPFNGEFYHDDVNGYVFSWYGGGKIVMPNATNFRGAQGARDAEASGEIVRLPNAKDLADRANDIRIEALERFKRLTEGIDKCFKDRARQVFD